MSSPKPPRKKRAFQHTEEKWNEMKAIIYDLWITKNMTMPQLKKKLEDYYGFPANERQLQLKHKQWNMQKNIKKEHARKITEDILRRESKGEELPIIKSGEVELDPGRVERLVERYRSEVLEDIMTKSNSSDGQEEHELMQEPMDTTTNLDPPQFQSQVEEIDEHLNVIDSDPWVAPASRDVINLEFFSMPDSKAATVTTTVMENLPSTESWSNDPFNYLEESQMNSDMLLSESRCATPGFVEMAAMKKILPQSTSITRLTMSTPFDEWSTYNLSLDVHYDPISLLSHVRGLIPANVLQHNIPNNLFTNFQLHVLGSGINSNTISALYSLAYEMRSWWQSGYASEFEEILQLPMRLTKGLESTKVSEQMWASTCILNAEVYSWRGEYAEGEARLWKLVGLCESKWGKMHMVTLRAKRSLCNNYRRQGNIEQAQRLAEYVRQAYHDRGNIESLDFDHPQCVLAYIYEMKFDYKSAYELLKRAYASRLKAFGRYHTYVAGSLSELGFCAMKLGLYAEAQFCLVQALQMQQQTLGPSHDLVLYTSSRLYTTFLYTGQHETARQIAQQALNAQITALQMTGQEYATAVNDLAKRFLISPKKKQLTILSRVGEIESMVREVIDIDTLYATALLDETSSLNQQSRQSTPALSNLQPGAFRSSPDFKTPFWHTSS